MVLNADQIEPGLVGRDNLFNGQIGLERVGYHEHAKPRHGG